VLAALAVHKSMRRGLMNREGEAEVVAHLIAPSRDKI
jgi:hypothetical protein|tara:strand:+ start:509 stop:619 length:111 start_codon:yes stop_codon:yes gene_type:complete